MRIPLWLRETGILYLRYMIAAVSAVPPSIAYVYLRIRGLDFSWAVGIVLFAGVACAAICWKASATLFSQKEVPSLYQGLNSDANTFGYMVTGTAMSASSTMLCGPSVRQSAIFGKNLTSGRTQILIAPGAIEAAA
jgi:hypothetical protein